MITGPHEDADWIGHIKPRTPPAPPPAPAPAPAPPQGKTDAQRAREQMRTIK